MYTWLELTDIPAQGRDFSFEESRDWDELLHKHSMQGSPESDIQLGLHVLPQSEGFLLTGYLKGVFSLPCERCLKSAKVGVDRKFQIFEDFSAASDTPLESLLREISGHWELNIEHLMWEQFNLSLPGKILCSEECKGLCPHCGKDLNEGPCSCSTEKTDPRLEIFKKIKISK